MPETVNADVITVTEKLDLTQAQVLNGDGKDISRQLDDLDLFSTVELTQLDGVTAGTVAASKALVVDASKDLATLGSVTATTFTDGTATLTAGAASGLASVTIAGAATGVDHPINLNSVTAMTGDETTDCGNILKINRSAGAIGGTHSGIICKHYVSGGDVDGTGLVSGLYVNLKYEPDTANAAAEASLIEAHLYGDSSDAIDYGMYMLAPNSKVGSMFCASGTMTNFLHCKAAGAAGVTVSSDGMTADPEGSTEDGYITIDIAGTSYQIPIYVA